MTSDSASRWEKFIDVGNDIDVREWCVRLECTEVELRTAVNAVGARPSWVAGYVTARGRRIAVRPSG